jgi:hypothetical protein
MGSLPTALQRCRKTVLLTLGWRQEAVATSDDSLPSPNSGNGDQLLWWLSNDGEGTNWSGGPQQISQDTWFGMGGSTPMWW